MTNKITDGEVASNMIPRNNDKRSWYSIFLFASIDRNVAALARKQATAKRSFFTAEFQKESIVPAMVTGACAVSQDKTLIDRIKLLTVIIHISTRNYFCVTSDVGFGAAKKTDEDRCVCICKHLMLDYQIHIKFTHKNNMKAQSIFSTAY